MLSTLSSLVCSHRHSAVRDPSSGAGGRQCVWALLALLAMLPLGCTSPNKWMMPLPGVYSCGQPDEYARILPDRSGSFLIRDWANDLKESVFTWDMFGDYFVYAFLYMPSSISEGIFFAEVRQLDANGFWIRQPFNDGATRRGPVRFSEWEYWSRLKATEAEPILKKWKTCSPLWKGVRNWRDGESR